MVCFKPMQGQKSFDNKCEFDREAQDKFYNKSYTSKQLKEENSWYQTMKCGKCLGCRVDHAKEWTVRMVHEAQMYDENCFITLTYDQENLPKGGTLVKEDFTAFLKRLREHVSRKEDKTFRFYMCGEYGEKYARPHYHAILFGYDFKDKIATFTGKKNIDYMSDELTKIWGKGRATIGTVTQQSCGYVASYVLKKTKKPKSNDGWEKLFNIRQDIRIPEYSQMSRDGFIGKPWLEQFYKDVYGVDDFVVIDNKKYQIPRAYDEWYKKQYPYFYVKRKLQRQERAKNLIVTAKNLCDKEKNLKSALSIKSKTLDSQVA